MSVLTRPITPTQRTPLPDVPTPSRPPVGSASRSRRTKLLIAGAAVVVTAGVGTTAYVLIDDGSPAAPAPAAELDSGGTQTESTSTRGGFVE